MTNHHPYSLRNNLAPVFLALFFITVFYAQSSAQSVADKNEDKIVPPADEEFQEVDALASPWWSSGCISVDKKLQDPNCKVISDTRWNDVSLSLYNPDGSVWYSFSLGEESPNYFVKYRQIINKPEFIRYRKEGFSPLGTPGVWFPGAVVLRMVGESPHWYKVEVNEETRDVRYILKSDSLWVKKSWDYWLFRGNEVSGSNYFLADKERALLRDKPDGKVIEDPDIQKLRACEFSRWTENGRTSKHPRSQAGSVGARDARCCSGAPLPS